VVAVADGGPFEGLGHLARSSGLVLALRGHGVDVECFALGTASDVSFDGVVWSVATWGRIRALGPERAAVVLDSNRSERDEVTTLATLTRLVWFEDHADPPPGAAMVISVTTKPPGPPSWCCGFEHACLRPSFWNPPASRVRACARRVLVTTGGGDPRGASVRLVEAVTAALPNADARLVVGPQAVGSVPPHVHIVDAPDSLFQELRASDLVVCGAGQTALEALRLGIPAVVAPLVPDQAEAAMRLQDARAARVLWPDEDLVAHVRELGTSPRIRIDLAAQGPRIIDGRGAARVGTRLRHLLRD
jgi:spore coat polysaccharide biosynthesis predicted glycosyltransferase SpsG